MCILITGSSGYFGRIVVSELICNGYRVVGIDITEASGQEEGELFQFYKCSITDKEKLREIFHREQPDVVIHFACTFNKVRNRNREYKIDVGGSVNVLEVSNETPSVKRIIYSSSAAIYGAHNRDGMWLSETTPINPGRYRYGVNKRLIEQALFSARRREDLRVVSLRICTVVGPAYSKPYSVVSILIRLPWLPSAFRYKKIQFMHEDDFTGIMGEVIRDNEIEGVFNLASDSYSVVGEVVPPKRYIRLPLSGLKPLLWLLWNLRILNLQPASLRYCLYPVLIDSSKLVKRYGYRFRYSSSESFADTVKTNRILADSRF